MFRIDWQAERLAAIEPTLDEVRAHADELAIGYNEPRNASLMGHTAALTPDEVIEHYADMADEGAHQFLLFANGALAGDADLRGIADGAAEFAFMIGAPAAQGKGLGTKFATMIYTFAFEQLGLARVYASVIPANTASKRVFEKLGCVVDDSAAARAYADEPDDIVMAIDRATFAARNQPALTIAPR
ncbi:MAG TPA: GNAT family N-acetyltransferase [Kofleriaceae bacterium]|nr:GNAT family N-acetyltransferase [Kofleriaceae bacterium]